ncbi:hypothetical protein M885DRAFT_624843 [Pelagophyceae sp. CCMP2097]|nr:hypothetical protein M885DRAFT_624843 [Pelagophyceae sp. CCMP2097]|mmetsp:Transcript_9594/g.31696  ORF Transcript_9594/g.31696 Transcript_9594/m.31696 type:complete len:211 (+) Transcript_9594:75-707(+)
MMRLLGALLCWNFVMGLQPGRSTQRRAGVSKAEADDDDARARKQKLQDAAAREGPRAAPDPTRSAPDPSWPKFAPAPQSSTAGDAEGSAADIRGRMADAGGAAAVRRQVVNAFDNLRPAEAGALFDALWARGPSDAAIRVLDLAQQGDAIEAAFQSGRVDAEEAGDAIRSVRSQIRTYSKGAPPDGDDYGDLSAFDLVFGLLSGKIPWSR